MKHLTYSRGFDLISRINLQRIKQFAEDLRQFGNIKVIFLKSNLPLMIFNKVKRGNEIEEDKSNHVIFEIDGKEIIEIYRKITKTYSGGIFHDENLSLSISKEVEELLTRFDLYTGDKLAEKKSWVSMVISLIPIIASAIVFLNLIFLIQMHNTNKMISPFYFYTSTDYLIKIIIIICWLFVALIYYRWHKRYFS